jgi:hypothetical protein
MGRSSSGTATEALTAAQHSKAVNSSKVKKQKQKQKEYELSNGKSLPQLLSMFIC